MSVPHRIKLKYFINEADTIELPAFIPVFHRWIQEERMEELLIDVADYKHVPNGPGIMLIGHEADYAIDMGQGKPGLMYTRKRLGDDVTDGAQAPNLADTLRTIFRQTLVGCQALESEPSLDGQIQFRIDKAELIFSDRLHSRNQAEAYAAVQNEVQAVVDELYGDTKVEIEPISTDPRRPFTLQIHAPDAPNINEVINRLN